MEQWLDTYCPVTKIEVSITNGCVDGDNHEFHIFKKHTGKTLFELDYIVDGKDKELDDMQYRDIDKDEFEAILKFLKENNYEAEWEEALENYLA